MDATALDWTRRYACAPCPCGSWRLASTCCWQPDGTWRKASLGPLAAGAGPEKNPACCLGALGGCSATLAKERFLPRFLLERRFAALERFGLAGGDAARPTFAGRQAEALHVDASALKVFCTAHDAALRPLDTAAAAAFQAIDSFADALHAVAAGEAASDVFSLCSGLDVERWLAKIFVALVAAGQLGGPDAITAELRACLMSGAGLPAPLGLHVQADPARARARDLAFGWIDGIGGLVFCSGMMTFVLVTQTGAAAPDEGFLRHRRVGCDVAHGPARAGFLFAY